MKLNIISALLTAAALQASASTINVADFGAVPNDNRDDTLAVKTALKACKEQGAATLVFPKGRYDFFPMYMEDRYCFISNNDEGLKRIAFPMYEMENLILDGQDSEFHFHGFINPFIVDHSKNITFKNFSIDFERPFHSEAIILDCDGEGMNLEIREGFPFKVDRGTLLFTDGQMDDGPQTTVSQGNIYGSRHMLEYDTEKRETAYMVRDLFFRFGDGYPAKLLGGRKVRITAPGLEGTPGNTIVFGPNHRDYPGFSLSDCADIVFRNITLHHSGGMGILGQRTHNVTVDHCRVTPSSGRMISTTADATHFVNCTGAIKLTDNLFENQKDDATNIHGIYVQVIEKTGDDSIIVQLKHRQQHGFDFLTAGTEVELVHGKSMITYAVTTVKSVERMNKEYTEVTFKSPLPAELEVGDALAQIRDYPDVLIAGNTIRNNRARGMLLNCRGKTVVENNYFHTPGAAILFEGDSFFWFEQGGVRDCIIRSNVFDNCLFGVWGKAVIDVKAGILENRETSRYNKNILIENNTFRMYDDITLLNAYCVEGLIWRNNKVEKTEDYPSRESSSEPFTITFCDQVEISR